GDKKALLVDLGGGSTELTLFNKGKSAFSMSLPMGTVRLLETFLRGAKRIEGDRGRLLVEGIDRALDEALPKISAKSFDWLIGTGGTVETLADLCPKPTTAKNPIRAIDVAALRALYPKLASMTTTERKDAFQLRPDRADTVLPAAAIYLRVADRFGHET